GLLHDDLREFAQLRVRELALEELCRSADPAQRILDLVREVAHELAVRELLLYQSGLARNLELLLELAEFEGDAGRRIAPAHGRFALAFHRRHDAVQVHGFPAQVEHELVLVEAAVAVEGLLDAAQEFVVTRERLVERRADEMLAAMREQRLGG